MMRIRALLALAAAAFTATPAATAPVKVVASASAEQRLGHISIVTVGSGDPLVLIPGMSTPRELWSGLAAELSADRRLILIQVNGFAGDDPGKNTEEGLLDGIVADIHRYLADNKLAPAAVVGHSMGGLVGMKLALAHPKAVDRLMVVDALPFFGTVFDDAATVGSVRTIAETMRGRLVAARDRARAAAATPVTSDPGGDMSKTAEGRIKVANWSMKADTAVAAQAVYEDLLTDLRQDIARIDAPMVVLHQNDSAGLNAKLYARDYAAQPKSKLVPISGAGHFIMLDQPQRFAEEVKSFLR